jgi:hypothetical protein
MLANKNNKHNNYLIKTYKILISVYMIIEIKMIKSNH